jgi:hypothetical protein
MEIIEGAIVGTAREWQKVYEVATRDDDENRNNSTVAVVVTSGGWGVAALDDRMATIHGVEAFKSELRKSIRYVVNSLSNEHDPKIVYRGGHTP